MLFHARMNFFRLLCIPEKIIPRSFRKFNIRANVSTKLITFDATNTLLHFREPVGMQYSLIAAHYGVSLDSNIVNSNFVAAFKFFNETLPNFGLNSSVGNWEAWWTHVVKTTLRKSGAECEEKVLSLIADELLQYYSTEKPWVVQQGTESFFLKIRGSGIVVGCISNFDPRLVLILNRLGLRSLFDFILTSYEVGETKPHPRIFSEALRASGIYALEAGNAMHVGDNVNLDYHGAKDAGWDAVLFRKPDQPRTKSMASIPKEDIVTTFDQLFDRIR
ncbi:unnamed protein product [Notodromas monacha]|uniref:Haloacid dehalogenase-like hydrolase domain-containing protein 3 n=1 Tax=Notodromas monacha TaxID=399045 RepID=A0A7R9BYV0_9CRUS|nr:unnamed protein product [Notodromas monacha]CAG0924273.1 unnamed protein product [Notodromas monacha]